MTGLSLHKPSPLWPPPSNDVRDRVRSGLRKSIVDRHSKVGHRTPQASPPLAPENVVPNSIPTTSVPMNVGSMASLPLPGGPNANQRIVLRAAGGEVIKVAQQVQFDAPNSLLKHPLVSLALSLLGGLPTLFFIADDRGVLRDEIIYTCVLFFLIF